LREGPAAIAADDGLRLVSSRHALAVMHREVVARRAHPDWGDSAAAASIADASDDGAVAEPVAVAVAEPIARDSHRSAREVETASEFARVATTEPF